MNMFCTGCGAQIPDNSRNCPYCGMRVFDEAPNYNDSNMNNNPNMGSDASMGGSPNMGGDASMGGSPNMGGNANMGGNMYGARGKFCMSCGTENDSDSQFCVVCGKPLDESRISANANPQGGADPRHNTNPNYNTNPNANYDSNNGQQRWDTWNSAAADQQKKRYRTIGIVGAGVIIVAAVLVLVFGVFGVFSKRSYEDTIEETMNAAMSWDFVSLFELIPPGAFSNQLDEMMAEYDLEWEYSIRYTEELTGSSLASIQDTYDVYGIDVEEAMVAAIRVTSSSGTYEAFETEEDFEIYLIKVDGEWYLDFENTDLFTSSFDFDLF